MSEWKKLSDLVERKICYGIVQPGNKAGNVPIIKVNNIIAGLNTVENLETTTEEIASKYERTKLKGGELIISLVGTVGVTAIVPHSFAGCNLVRATGMIDIVDDVLAKYVKYYLETKSAKEFLYGRLNTTVQPTLNVKTLENLPIPIIDRKKIIAITSILSSLDDKIAVNRRICENLEAQAQALFKHWFIDFAPFKNGNFFANREQNETCFNSAEVQPKITGKACKFVESELGMIPEGWRVGTLTEIAEYLNGLAMQKFPPLSADDAIPVLKIKELGQSQCDDSSDKCSKQIKPEYIIKNGDVVFSWSGTLMVDIWCGGICGLNQHLFKVTSDHYPKWFYLMWTKHHLAEFIRIAKDKAVTMGHIKRGDLEKALVAIPDSDTLDKMSKVMEDIYNQIINTRLESNSLSTLRDTLLPKLMSGQIII